jgi:hypothetical protein
MAAMTIPFAKVDIGPKRAIKTPVIKDTVVKPFWKARSNIKSPSVRDVVQTSFIVEPLIAAIMDMEERKL